MVVINHFPPLRNLSLSVEIWNALDMKLRRVNQERQKNGHPELTSNDLIIQILEEALLKR